jgi:hypothetical protein
VSIFGILKRRSGEEKTDADILRFRQNRSRYRAATVLRLAARESLLTQAASLLVAEPVKYQAPPRRQTAVFSNSVTDLRRRSAHHPTFGPLDGYQWILVIAAHGARHTEQILEVRDGLNFPAN